MKYCKINNNLAIMGISFLLVLNCPKGNSTTIEVSDNIDSDTTWMADTVKILNDITILPSATLTVSPGTYIEFQGHYKLQVEGRIMAIGSAEDNIIFTVNDTTGLYNIETTQGGWNGIDFIVTAGDTSRLEYCVLEYGKASDGLPDWNNVEDNGGAILCSYNTVPLVVKNCTLQYCVAVSAGAIKCHQGIVILLNNVIKNNKADDGGAISLGYSNGIIASNIFSNNSTLYGGIVTLDNTNGLIVNNLIVNNDIKDSQGTVYVNSANISNRFSFFNNVIANNLLQGTCAGIYIAHVGSHPPFKNNIFWGNQAQGDNYAIYPDTIINVEYNDIEGGYTGTGNIESDPEFVDPSSGAGAQYDGTLADWSIKSTSPCIDAGKPDITIDSLGVETDFAGSPRIQYSVIDMGAFEITNITTIIEPAANEIDQGRICIFPNPACDFFTVTAASGSVINLFTQTGILIERKTVIKSPAFFDSSILPCGLYMVEINDGHSISIRKVILNRPF